MLDQGQTITIDATDQVYNLTVFDGLHTERVAKLANGQATKLNIDHTEGKTQASNTRHLAQYIENVVDSVSGVAGSITVNITVSAPQWADSARVEDVAAGFSSWHLTNLARMLGLES